MLFISSATATAVALYRSGCCCAAACGRVGRGHGAITFLSNGWHARADGGFLGDDVRLHRASPPLACEFTPLLVLQTSSQITLPLSG